MATTPVPGDDVVTALMSKVKANTPDPDSLDNLESLLNYELGARAMLRFLHELGALADADKAGTGASVTGALQRVEVAGLAEILHELNVKASVPARVEVVSMPDRAHALVRDQRTGKPTGSVESDV